MPETFLIFNIYIFWLLQGARVDNCCHVPGYIACQNGFSSVAFFIQQV